MNRFHQPLLISTFLPFCWLAMMVVHELGHIVGAYATGGTVSKVVLHPLVISRTDLSENPSPTIVVWAGPIIGVLLPLVYSLFMKFVKSPREYLARFFAGFCLIANGTYIGFGSFDGVGDAGEMLRLGSPIWCLWLFSVITFPVGLYLWHGLGKSFGLGHGKGKLAHHDVFITCGLLLLILVLEWRFGSR